MALEDSIRFYNRGPGPAGWHPRKDADGLRSRVRRIRRPDEFPRRQAKTTSAPVSQVVNRDDDLRNWVELFRTIRKTMPDLKIYAYANNHYEVHGPGTVKL